MTLVEVATKKRAEYDESLYLSPLVGPRALRRPRRNLPAPPSPSQSV